MPANALPGQYAYYAKDSKTGVLSNKIIYTVRGVVTKKVEPEARETKKASAVKPKEEKKTGVKKEKVVKREIQECGFNTNQQPSHNEIIISEVAWMGGLSSAGLGASDEWIELKNLTNKPINIDGWQVVDQDESIQAVFKAGSVIPANGFYLLERTNDDSVPGVTADLIYTGALTNNDEGLRLFASDCSLIDEVLAKPNWPAGDNSSRRTMQRNEDLTWSTFGGGASSGVLGTPKRENGVAWASPQPQGSQSSGGGSSGGSSGGGSGGGGSSGSDNQSGVPTQADVLITEIQITGGAGKTDNDFIEIFNPTSSSVNLNGHRLVKRTKTGTSDSSIKSWTSDTIIPANSYYLWANSNYPSSTTPDVTTSATISNDNGVAIRFGAEDTGTIVDSVGWGEAANAFVEGVVFSTNPGTNESIHRKTGSGYVDTGNNANDFELKTCLTPKAPPCEPANQAPSVVLNFSPMSPTTVDTVSFSGASSSDSDGSISSYSWDFGDGDLASST
ncbi:MAG: lamin tail domain-containing protein, partial [Candidatus Wildermuthbacteria bacterium]|nr:lamin tail domain-containing protein [Candidatus Wildermuthbacteria bacterium]